MSGSLILDAEALSTLAGPPGPRKRVVRAAMHAAARLGRQVVVPTAILAELYRGRAHASAIDACLSRETGIRLRDTDRSLARLVGGVLAAAGAGSEHVADAHAVAAAVEVGGGVILTGDSEDLSRLGAPYRQVVVVALS